MRMKPRACECAHRASMIEGEFVYAVTAVEDVILSLFTSNEQ